MDWVRKAGLAVAAAVVSACAIAQGPAAVVTRGNLDAKVKELRAKAQADGAASVKLETYPNHYTMIAVRTKTGGAEVHARFADFFLVLEGTGRLVTGGTLANATGTGTDEVRGTAVTGGTEQEVKPGDVVHIPAGVPHQLLIPDGVEFAYYVVKVQEKP
jgi:mannose-6-phosphate isomerase-like protein (cupin superfamily)